LIGFSKKTQRKNDESRQVGQQAGGYSGWMFVCLTVHEAPVARFKSTASDDGGELR